MELESVEQVNYFSSLVAKSSGLIAGSKTKPPDPSIVAALQGFWIYEEEFRIVGFERLLSILPVGVVMLLEFGTNNFGL